MRIFAFALLSGFALAVSTFGCSDPVEPIPAGGWAISFTHPGATCNIPPHNANVGTVASDGTTKLVTDGVASAQVECSVKPTGSTFEVSGKALQNGENLALGVKGLTKDATEANPVSGTISFISPQSVNVFTSPVATPCTFYFVEGTKEAVTPGAVWVSFTCASVQDGNNDCALSGVAKFQNCEGVPEED